MVLRKIFEPHREWQNTAEKCTMTTITICTPHQILFSKSYQGRQAWWFTWHIWWRREIYAYRILVGKPVGKRQFGPVSINGNIILKRILKKVETYWISMPQDGGKWWVVVNMELEVKVVWAPNRHKIDRQWALTLTHADEWADPKWFVALTVYSPESNALAWIISKATYPKS